jgi:hypothetical protein
MGQITGDVARVRRMNRSEFEAAFRALLADHARSTESSGSIACERCERATDCTFCVDCKQITRCHYCRDCIGCTECSHTTLSRDCIGCNHCHGCERCAQSAYLVRCVGCTGCNYCFGCVGLMRKDFHILNEPYDRDSYFQLTARLMRELGIRS